MIAITPQMKKAILDRRAQRLKLTISGADSIITLTESNVASGGFAVDRHVTATEHLTLGSASAADLELTLANLNGEFDDFKFEGAEIRPEVIIDSREYSVMSAVGKNLTIEGTEDEPLAGLTIYGKTTQDGIPAPDAPIPLKNVGSDGVLAKIESAQCILFPDSKSVIQNGVTATFEDGKITLSGTSTSNVWLTAFTLSLDAGEYTLSSDFIPSGVAVYIFSSAEYFFIRSGALVKTKIFSQGNYNFVIEISANVTLNDEFRVMLNKGKTAIPWQPYSQQQIITTISNGVSGIPVTSGGNYTDENGQQWICDEIDFERGVLIKRTHTITFDGTEDFINLGVAGSSNAFFCQIDASVKPLVVNNEGFSLCSHFEQKRIMSSTTDIGHQVRKTSTGENYRLLFRPEGVANMTGSDFMRWLKANKPTVTYALATPIETALSISDISSFNELHTLNNITLINGEGDMRIKYLVSGDRDDKVGTKSFTFTFPFGYFTIDNQPRKLSKISITALDRMVLFDKKVDWSILRFPMSVSSLLLQICNVCNVALYTAPTELVNSGYIITAQPELNGDVTYRQLLMWISQITASNAYIDENGLLRLSWVEETDETIAETERYSSDVQENDITITGVVLNDGETEYIAGSTDYAISISNNALITHDQQEVIENIFSVISATKYRPLECSLMPLPYIYPLDKVAFQTEDGEKVSTVITHVNFKLNGASSIRSVGETSQRNSYASVNPLTASESAIIQRLREEMNKTLNDRIQAVIGFNELITNSMGLYSTTVQKENGSRQTYMHNAPELDKSMTIYTLTEGGFAYTNSGWNGGSPDWEYGFDKLGNAIFNKVCAYGIEVSDPNTKYSAKINPEAFETYFGTMLTSSFNGELSRVSKMKIIESLQTGKSLLVPHYEEDEATGKPELIGTDLIFEEA